MNRPSLDKTLDENIFRDFYYLKEELVTFCKLEDIQAAGSKEELTNRIAHFLRTGEKRKAIVNEKQIVNEK